mmetsp:Transcript_47726/g.137881  ORF Transcript_47726/g.137881 Transcript_47726/m.137881 type:complete len:82 (+) Transcript_47726:1236-1481(+)
MLKRGQSAPTEGTSWLVATSPTFAFMKSTDGTLGKSKHRGQEATSEGMVQRLCLCLNGISCHGILWRLQEEYPALSPAGVR